MELIKSLKISNSGWLESAGGGFVERTRTKRTSIKSGGVWLLLLILPMLSGCNSGENKPLDPIQASQAIRALITNSLTLSGNHSCLFAQPSDLTRNLPWKVHVDLSTGMQGFVNPEASDYKAFLEHMNRYLPEGSVWQGEGENALGGIETPKFGGFDDLFKPGQYVRSGVNYSNLFAKFTAETSFNHMLITDGVLFYRGRLLPPRSVTAPLRYLLSYGGDFSLLAMISSYDGTYVSARLVSGGSTDPGVLIRTNRPFLAWAYIQPGQSLSSGSDKTGTLKRLLGKTQEPTSEGKARLASGQWVELFPLSRGCGEVTMTNTTKALPGLKVSASMTATRLSGLATTWKAEIYGGEAVQLDFLLPSSFVGAPVRRSDSTNSQDRVYGTSEDYLKQLRLDLRCWEMGNSGKLMDGGKLFGLSLEDRVPRVGWNCVWTNLDSQQPQTPNLNLNLAQRRPECTNQWLVWLATVNGPVAPAQERLWQSLSTNDDSSPTNGGAIYGLAEFLEAIHQDCLVMNRWVFFTYWPK